MVQFRAQIVKYLCKQSKIDCIIVVKHTQGDKTYMQLVTDNAADLAQSQIDELDVKIHRVPLSFTLSGKSYQEIDPGEFYKMLEATDDMPQTSQPAPTDFVDLYKRVAEETGDREILSVHISSGLSGTPNAARLAAEQVAQDDIMVHLIDTRTLSVPEGWQVQAAARGIAAGYSVDQIRELLDKVGDTSEAIFTLPDLKYLIHGGRISHLTGLVASTLGIKPLIGVDRETGKYDTRGRVRTFKRAVNHIPNVISDTIPEGENLKIQPLHANNPDGVEQMLDAIRKKYTITELLPTVGIAPVLGAHTGSGLVGCAYAPADKYPDLP